MTSFSFFSSSFFFLEERGRNFIISLFMLYIMSERYLYNIHAFLAISAFLGKKRVIFGDEKIYDMSQTLSTGQWSLVTGYQCQPIRRLTSNHPTYLPNVNSPIKTQIKPKIKHDKRTNKREPSSSNTTKLINRPQTPHTNYTYIGARVAGFGGTHWPCARHMTMCSNRTKNPKKKQQQTNKCVRPYISPYTHWQTGRHSTIYNNVVRCNVNALCRRFIHSKICDQKMLLFYYFFGDVLCSSRNYSYCFFFVFRNKKKYIEKTNNNRLNKDLCVEFHLLYCS